MGKTARGIIGLLLGLLATPIALFLAMLSGGAGHGNYVAAKALYPLPMLLAQWMDVIATPSLVLALLQFPLYGFISGRFGPAGAIVSLIVHFIAIVLCFASDGVF